MKTDLAPSRSPDLAPARAPDLELMPRADLPVIWDGFRQKAEELRKTAETLTVTDISQKEEMALARTTRLTLKEIRIAVENKRVELGEGHLKEIKKVNGAANAIKDFISPLEARLLIQEGFADRFEANRIAELSKSRLAELKAIRVCLYPTDLGTMLQADYDAYIARLRSEQAEIEAANRLRIEAERKLAEAQAEALRVAEVTRATIELAQRVALEEKNRRDAEVRAELDRQHKAYLAENEARLAAAEAERAEERKAAQALAEVTRANVKAEQERLEAQAAVRNADLAEQKRIRDEQFAKLEAQLAAAEQEKAAIALDAAHKVAVEEARLRRIAVAPDIEKMRDYASTLRGIIIPNVGSSPAQAVVREMVSLVSRASALVENFCCDEGLTGE